MFYKLAFSLTVVFLSYTLTLHSENFQKKNIQNLLIEHLETTNQIILYAPYAIKKYEDGKLYLDENYINQIDSDAAIFLNNGNTLTLPKLIKDYDGYFLVAKKSVENKLFKLVCNKCHYEWTGNVFTVRCPKCHSTDFRIEPNW